MTLVKQRMWLPLAIVVLSFFIPRIVHRLFFAGWQEQQAAVSTHRTLLRDLKSMAFPRISESYHPLGPRQAGLRVAIGYNGNLDLIVHDSEKLMEQLMRDEKWLFTGKEGKDWVAQDHYVIHNTSQLWESYVHFFGRGSATERFVANAELFDWLIASSEEFVEIHDQTSRDGGYHIGGNAALMATKFASEGWNVLLGGALGPKLRELMTEKDFDVLANDAHVAPSLGGRKRFGTIHFAKGDDGEESVDRDEVHLILEYAKNSQLRFGFQGESLDSPRANRYIATRDLINGQFLSLVPLHKEIQKFEPHLLIVSGFHLMDGELDAEKRHSTLEKIKTELASEHTQSIPFIHLELASMGSRERYHEVADALFPHIRSLGLNEQELAYMNDMLTEGHTRLDKIAQPKPNIEHVRQALSLIMQHYPSLQRIHFHCLAFHSVVHRIGDGGGESLNDLRPSFTNHTVAAKAAIAGSSLAATQRACGLDSVNDIATIVEQGLETPFNVPREVHRFATLHEANTDIVINNQDTVKNVISWKQMSDDLEFLTTPVMVCSRVVKTVGLGDVISSAGLVHQLEVIQHDAPHLFDAPQQIH